MAEPTMDQLAAEAELLDFVQEDRIEVIAPNPELFHRDVIGGRALIFPPFKKFLVKRELGAFLAERASEQWRQSKMNAQYERQHWATCTNSADYWKRDKAKDFCDENGVPNTRVLPRPGLVRLDTEEGKNWLREGAEHARKLKESENPKDLYRYREMYERFLYDPAEKEVLRSGEKTGRDTQSRLTEISEAPDAAFDVELEKPDESWELEQKTGYLQRHTGEKPSDGLTPKQLNKRMWEVFKATKEKWDKAGVKYKEV